MRHIDPCVPTVPASGLDYKEREKDTGSAAESRGVHGGVMKKTVNPGIIICREALGFLTRKCLAVEVDQLMTRFEGCSV